MSYSRGLARPWLLALGIVVLLVASVVTVRLLSSQPQQPSVEDGGQSPATAEEEESVAVRSIVVTDGEALPLLPLAGARLHFMPGNKIQVSYKSIPIQPVINCGVSGGMLWFSGIPSWIDLFRIDENIDSYLSRWTPAWSFTIDTLVASATSIIIPGDEVSIVDATPTFNWASIADESGVKYSLQVDNDSDFSSPLVNKSKIYSPSYSLTNEEALSHGKYYWRVMQRGKVWIIGMAPWLDISRYDPEVTELPTIVNIETGDGEVKISYIIE